MEGMFEGAGSFDQPLDNWNVSNVTNMSGMFWGAKSFSNQDLSKQDVDKVISYYGLACCWGPGNKGPNWKQ